jgi:hypothetical protein
MYVCCPDNGCGAFQDTANWLKSWGIEPALGLDEHGHYLDFRPPSDRERRKRFRRELKARCCSCSFCGRVKKSLSELQHYCGAMFLVCQDCFESQAINCPQCGD